MVYFLRGENDPDVYAAISVGINTIYNIFV